jgi:sugar O-acyltransferase (sialic acid O-acetyltransferase NeuD family)
MQKIIIIGASGQGKNIALLIEQIGGYEILGFVDDDETKKGSLVKGYTVLGPVDEVFSTLENISIANAIGNSKVVEKIIDKLKEMNKGFIFPNLIHPSVQIDRTSVKLGEGNLFNANVVITADISIGDFNYFNRCCSISHDSVIGNYNFIHSGVHPCGGLNMGHKNWLGVGSVVIQGVKLGNNITIGAGAVVLKEVADNSIMVGNPAKLLRYKEIESKQDNIGDKNI